MRRRIPAGARSTFFLAACALLALAWLGLGTAHATFPGENGRIAFTNEPGGIVSSDIWVTNPNGTHQTRLTCGGRAWEPAWSPDGRRIAFVNKPRVGAFSGEISVMDADGSNRTGLGPFGEDLLAWSPSSERIAFHRFVRMRPDVFLHIGVVNADGSGRTTVVAQDVSVGLTRQPWSPDGLKLVLGEPTSRIFDVDTGESREFVDRAEGPAWSSGDVIAFARPPFSRSSNIWTVSPDGSDESQLTETAESEGVPLWSPDGSRIAFRRSRDLWVMNADGSGQRRLATGTGPTRAAWSPDGQRIAFLRAGGLWVINADGTDQKRLASAREVGGSVDWQPLPAGAELGPPPSQFCFKRLRRNTKRGIARLVVEVPRPGRVLLRPRPGVKRFVQAHRTAGPGRVVLRVRPRGKARQRLNRKNRVRARAQVTYRPGIGDLRTKGRRAWLVKR